MNFAELKVEFFDRGFNYLEEDASDVARAERWLNQGYREILNLQAWPFLQATVTGAAGAGNVSIPDLRRILYVVDASNNNRVLRYSSAEDLITVDNEPVLTATGNPEFYYVLDNIVFGHPLGGTLSSRYVKRVAPMTGTDTPAFDEEYHNLIVDKAVIKAYIDSDNYEGASALQQALDQALAAMAEDYHIVSRERQFIQPFGTDMEI